MQLTNHYWYFDGVLSEKFCDDVIKFGLQQQDKIGLTGDSKELEQDETKKQDFLKNVRNSNICWLSDAWIHFEVMNWTSIANKNAGWNFQLDFPEQLQFTKYKLNQHYNWHKDGYELPYSEGDCKGKIRKLSSIFLISDPNDYKGGELEFNFNNDIKKPQTHQVPKLNRGSIIIFPSFVWHKVNSVTSGTRYSLVNWHLGNPFR